MEIKPLKESNDSQELIPVDISDWKLKDLTAHYQVWNS